MTQVYTPQLKVQLSVRVPQDLAEYIRRYAEEKTGGNLSKALEEILYKCLTACRS
jgi:hypothetical protein